MLNINISVRNLVEFVCRSGSYDRSSDYLRDPNVLQEGIRAHKAFQKMQGPTYESEVSLEFRKEYSYQEFLNKNLGDNIPDIGISLFGRADGIFDANAMDFSPELVLFEEDNRLIEERFIQASSDTKPKNKIIDEIKSSYRNINKMTEPDKTHLAQAQCYAYIYAAQNHLDWIGVRMVYIQLGTKRKKNFFYSYSFEEIEKIVLGMVDTYAKWCYMQIEHLIKRNLFIEEMEFPFPYREGQRELCNDVYLTISREKRLFLEAPTGTGKTIANLFPAIYSLGKLLATRIFYLTAKNITQTVPIETMQLLSKRSGFVKVAEEVDIEEDLREENDSSIDEKDSKDEKDSPNEKNSDEIDSINDSGDDEDLVPLTTVVINAREKSCISSEVSCTPEDCVYAASHFDNINNALWDLLHEESLITQEVIKTYAEKYKVCPYLLSKEAAYFGDIIICDVNYVFAPDVQLSGFFSPASAESKDIFDVTTDYLRANQGVSKAENDGRFIFLIDEAHNMVSRARNIFTTEISLKNTIEFKLMLSEFAKRKGFSKLVINNIDELLKDVKSSIEVLEGFRDLNDFSYHKTYRLSKGDVEALNGNLQSVRVRLEQLLSKRPFREKLAVSSKNEDFIEYYFNLIKCTEYIVFNQENYMDYAMMVPKDDMIVRLDCIEPKEILEQYLKLARSTVFFSATLRPVNYFKEQLAGREDDYCVYAPSVFDKSHRRVLVGNDVSSKYKNRNDAEYEKICDYICSAVEEKVGNYMVFFPSYQFLSDVLEHLVDRFESYEMGEVSSELEGDLEK
nr:hypothetical protein [Lachnospiraceae bacterium]